MSNLASHAEEFKKRYGRLPSGPPQSYDGGDGGGSEMEQRVRQLESDMSFINGKLDDMPTKDWVTTRLIWVVLAVGAIGAFVEAGGRLIP